MLKVSFLGSSTLEGFSGFEDDLKTLIDQLFLYGDDELVIVTGGYKGLMEKISVLADQIKREKNRVRGEEKFRLNILGILFDGYKNDPLNIDPSYKLNEPNAYNHFHISTASIGERTQNLIQLSDVVIGLPGSTGTLHEILHCIEHIKYGMDYKNEINFNKLILHSFWNEGKLAYLKDQNILSNKIYEQLIFWNKAENAKLVEALDNAKKISNKENTFHKTSKLYITISDFDNNQNPLPSNSEEFNFINDINEYIQGSYPSDKNHLIGLDIVIVDTNKGEIIKLTSIGIPKYLEALQSFLKKNSSILSDIQYLSNNLNWFECCELINIKPNEETNYLIKIDFTKDVNQLTSSASATFSNWKEHLQNNNLGKSVIWITLPALGDRYVISAFVSLDIFVPEISKLRIKSILTSFLYNQTLTEIHNKLTEDLFRQATVAAISQVMARNMSHNIGSHVISRLVTVESLKSYLDYSIQNKTNSYSESPFKNYTTLNIHSNEEQSGSQLFATFNSYQKSRMDFLADVTFGEPTIETSKLFFSEVMRDLDKNRILLENISGTNDFEYEFIIRNLANCENRKDEPCLEKCDCCIVNNKSQKEKDIAVSIPNDILGCHAFYLILENIIRNCAKHGVEKKGRKIYIDFDKSEREDDYYKVNIYDNSNPFGNDLERLDYFVKEQNEKLNQNILEGNKLRQGGWGLIEMEAASAYLRKHPLEDINGDDFFIDIDDQSNIYPEGKTEENHVGKPNFLKALRVHTHYGYRLFLLKPKELLIIYDKAAEDFIMQISHEKNELRKNGIKILTIDEFNVAIAQEKVVYSYPILIFAGSEEIYDEKIKLNESSLPIRHLVCLTGEEIENIASSYSLTDAKHRNTRFSFNLSKENFSKILNQDEPRKILNEVWKAWVIKQFRYLGIKINHVFKQKDNAKELLLKECEQEGKKYFSNKPHVFFSDHAIDFCKTICINNDQESYSEPYNSKDYFLLGKFIKNEEKNFPEKLSKEDIPGLCKLIEGTATTVHIIDERIQELAEKTPYKPERGNEQKFDDSINELLYTDLLYCTHVVVPYSGADNPKLLRKINDFETFNLNSKAYKPIRDKIIHYLRSVIKTADDPSYTKAKADFLLIHLGVIEKLISSHPNKEKRNKEKEGIKEFIQSEILQDKDNTDTKVIIISGRGKPHNLPENYLYLNFSIVAQYCIENRLKYYLNEVVHSAKHI